MPVSTLTEFRDAVFEQFHSVWDLLPTPPAVFYDDKDHDTPEGDPWVKLTISPNGGRQSSLGTANNRRFENSGVVTVEVYTPPGDGAVDNDLFVQTAINAFEGVCIGGKGIFFRNTRPFRIGHNRGFYQTNVVTEYEYDRIR